MVSKWVSLVCVLLFSFSSQAKLIQIIHTNDLHSHFTGKHDGRGGYPKMMTKIKEIRSAAAAKGIDVIQLDGGDWGEGTGFFHIDKGVASLKALELLGTDVSTIGNHDHQLGGAELGIMLKRANTKTKFTVANLVPTPEMGLDGVLAPYVDMNRAGLNIRVIGLTTPESFFQYSMSPGKIDYPNKIGEGQAKKAKTEGKQLVIALTHLGYYGDQSLAANSSAIDVIVGGHTHMRLHKPVYIKNLKGKLVPIVQASGHTLAVGSLLVDVNEDGSGAKVVDYKLHEITADITPDPEMQAFMDEMVIKRNEVFGNRWDEVVGETKVPIAGFKNGQISYRRTCWGWHMATAARLAGKADVGIHVSSFEGMAKDPGPVTFGDIADSFPHFRKWGDPGWEIVTSRISATKLRAAMWYISRRGNGVTFSGLGYKDIPADEKGYYTVAFPAEAALAIKTSFPGYRQYLAGLKYTGKYYWPVMMDYVKQNSPLKCK